MWIAYRGSRREFPWPELAAWNYAPVQARRVPGLADRRSAPAEDKGLVFSIFDGFRALVDDLVAWFDRFFLWLTWPGVTVLGTLLVWRLGGVRAALIVLVAFASYALSGSGRRAWRPSR